MGIRITKRINAICSRFYDDREIEENERQSLQERQLDNLGLTDDTERTFMAAAMDDSSRIQQDIDREEFDLSMLPEDDDHGDNDDVQYGYF